MTHPLGETFHSIQGGRDLAGQPVAVTRLARCNAGRPLEGTAEPEAEATRKRLAPVTMQAT